MSELLREIEEDIRREQMDRLWARFGNIVIVASLAVVLATAAYVFWDNQQQARAQAQTAQLIDGIDRLQHQDYAAAIADFNALSANDHSFYYGIAMLHKAEAQAASGDKAAAEKTYAALAQHNNAFGQLAQMHLPFDAAHPALPAKTAPLYATQSEWAGWQWLGQGRKDNAIHQFLALRDNADAPVTMRRRLQEIVQYLAPDKAAIKGGVHE